MRAVIQRVQRAAVRVDGRTVGRIEQGLLVLLGVRIGDGPEQARKMARKIIDLRIFDDGEGKMNRSLLETGGSLLLVSQFTLYGETRKGRRPSYIEAAPPAEAEILYEACVEACRGLMPSDRVQCGRFRAMMEVELVNDGPVTILVEMDRE